MVHSISVHSLSPSHILLLAIHCASSSDLDSLRSLRALHPTILTPACFLRILLFLPETLSASEYIPTLKKLLGTPTSFTEKSPECPTDLDITPVVNLSDKTIRKRLDGLLLHVPEFGGDSMEEMISSWLIIRSRNIDAETGMLSIVESLLAPFLDLAAVEKYYNGIVKVMSSLIYESTDREGPENDEDIELTESLSTPRGRGLSRFEELSATTAVRNLLSKATKETIVQEISTLIMPYLTYRDLNSKIEGWSVVWEWLVSQDLHTVLEVFSNWDGPLESGEGTESLMKGYARAGMASCYMCKEINVENIDAMKKIHSRIVDMLGLHDAVSTASRNDIDRENYKNSIDMKCMPDHLLQTTNALTSPTPESLNLLGLLISSAALLSISLYSTAQIRFTAGKEDQRTLLIRYVRHGNWTKRNEKEWRNVIDTTRWLRNSAGLFGQLSEEESEEILLRGLLTACKFKLAQDTYVKVDRPVLSIQKLEETVFDAFLEFYDNASNGNKTRGGMKNADNALQILYPTYSTADLLERASRLLSATHALSSYSLTLIPGTPLLPVQIRIHPDPISLIGHLLDQNPTAYTQLDKLVLIASDLHYGTVSKAEAVAWDEIKENDRVERRVLGMCIESALAEDDFDTAYSLIKSRLATPEGLNGTLIHTIPGTGGSQDESAWKACFQAGRYQSLKAQKRDSDELKRLEMQLELLAEALRICPLVACNEVLSVWMRKEEEMTVILAKEAKAEEVHAAPVLRGKKSKINIGGLVPGGWNSTTNLALTLTQTAIPPSRPSSIYSHSPVAEGTRSYTSSPPPAEDAERMGLFGLASAAAKGLSSTVRPLRGMGALAGSRAGTPRPASRASTDKTPTSPDNSDYAEGGNRARKRDMIASKLAGGIGWVLGAQAMNSNSGDR